jgi:hypothetical protein
MSGAMGNASVFLVAEVKEEIGAVTRKEGR